MEGNRQGDKPINQRPNLTDDRLYSFVDRFMGWIGERDQQPATAGALPEVPAKTASPASPVDQPGGRTGAKNIKAGVSGQGRPARANSSRAVKRPDSPPVLASTGVPSGRRETGEPRRNAPVAPPALLNGLGTTGVGPILGRKGQSARPATIHRDLSVIGYPIRVGHRPVAVKTQLPVSTPTLPAEVKDAVEAATAPVPVLELTDSISDAAAVLTPVQTSAACNEEASAALTPAPVIPSAIDGVRDMAAVVAAIPPALIARSFEQMSFAEGLGILTESDADSRRMILSTLPAGSAIRTAFEYALGRA